MAIVQISRITNRKGLTENLPQLAGAELGWAVDSRRLFIGNGTLQEGAPVIGNTEILTEFSDITALSDYTYSDIAVGYAAQTGPTASDPVVRTVQAKLDDFASVRDFGAVGDGLADDTEAINRALFQLYCVAGNTAVRRSLYFPAGTYRITESIIIPTFAKLVGEGADCSIIFLDTSSDISSLSAYVARFGDSKQQVGANIANNGATAPRNIEISYMTFQTQEETDIFLAEDASQCYFDSVNFIGPLTQATIPGVNNIGDIPNVNVTPPGNPQTTLNAVFSGALVNDGVQDLATTDWWVYNGAVWSNSGPSASPPAAVPDISCVRFASTPTLVCNQITFDKCRFSGMKYAFETDQQVQAVTISNGKFDTLYQGVVLGAGTPILGGPTGFRIVQNMFDLVFREGIVISDAELNVSAYNTFYNVAEGYTGNPIYPIITFATDNNVSLSDMFERTDAEALVNPRIRITGQYASNTTAQNQLGRYFRESGHTVDLFDNSVNQDVAIVNSSQTKAFRFDYTIVRLGAIRTGTITVAADLATPIPAYTDDYTENLDTGVTLAVSSGGTSVVVAYTTTATGSDGVLTYSISHLA